MAITWNSTMTTGLNNIDNQHRELFRQVDLLITAMSQGKGRQEVGRILDFLGQYVHDHFADEEREMDRYECPAAAANRTAHAQFITTFQAMRTARHRGQQSCYGRPNPEHADEVADRSYPPHRHPIVAVCQQRRTDCGRGQLRRRFNTCPLSLWERVRVNTAELVGCDVVICGCEFCGTGGLVPEGRLIIAQHVAMRSMAVLG